MSKTAQRKRSLYQQGRANAPDYVINYKHSLFLLNADGTPRQDIPQLHAVS